MGGRVVGGNPERDPARVQRRKRLGHAGEREALARAGRGLALEVATPDRVGASLLEALALAEAS